MCTYSDSLPTSVINHNHITYAELYPQPKPALQKPTSNLNLYKMKDILCINSCIKTHNFAVFLTDKQIQDEGTNTIYKERKEHLTE